MAKELSPEERLLRLIRQKRSGPFAPEEMIIPGKGGEGLRPEKEEEITAAKEKVTPSGEGPTQAESRKKEGPLSKAKPLGQIKGRLIGRARVAFSARGLYIISGAGLLLIAVFGAIIFSGRGKGELDSLERMIAAISKEGETEPVPAKAEDIEKSRKEPLPAKETRPEAETSFDEYQKLLAEKSIFAPARDREAPSAVVGPGLTELAKELRLVGIIPGAEPQAIIEDKKSAQTFFLKKGEQIQGIEIRDISNGRVVLGYAEESITLSL